MSHKMKHFFRAFSILMTGALVIPSITGIGVTFAGEESKASAEAAEAPEEVVEVSEELAEVSEEYMPDIEPPEILTSGDYEYYINDGGKSVTITGYNGDEEDVLIPATIEDYPVLAIGYEAFIYGEMKSLSVPEGIKGIEGRAFDHCKISDQLLLPEGIFIHNQAFCYAELPETLNIPAKAVVENSAFSYCDTIKQAVIDEETELLGRAFSYCDNLEQVVCADGVKMEKDAVEYCRELKDVILCGEVEMEEESLHYCGEYEITEAEAKDFADWKERTAEDEPETEEDVDIWELNWEDYTQDMTEEELGGRFEELPETGMELFIPDEFQPVELGKEYDGMGYIAYFAQDEKNLVPGISVQYVDSISFQDLTEYQGFLEGLKGLAEVKGVMTLNGEEYLVYEMPSNDITVIGRILDDGGIMEVAVMAEDEAYRDQLAELICASIREAK